MQALQRFSSLAIAVLAGFAYADAASAQAIIITNANNHQIPLASGSNVQIDVNGNLLAQCALNGSGVCTQLSSGSGGGGTGTPTVTFSRNDGDTDVRTGEFVRLAWNATNATVCHASTDGGTTTWTGPQGTSSGGLQVTVSAAGSYTFSLQCFNNAGGSTVATATASVTAADTGGGGGGTSNCEVTDPLIAPTGWVRADRTWQTAFSSPDGSPQAAYPNGVGFPVPIGAQRGSYTSIPFVPIANTRVTMTWDTAQANSLQGYTQPRPAESMFISISPCAGDLRAIEYAANADPWLRYGCRRLAGGSTMVYSTVPTDVTGDTLCKVTPGQTYYINVSPANPLDGLTPGEHTCSNTAANSANGCDVQMRHTGTTVGG